MICSGCSFPLRTSSSSFAITIRPVLPTGTTEVTYSQLFTTVDNRSPACDVHALIAQPHVYVCMFDWPNVLSALDTPAPLSCLDRLDVSIQLADHNLPCCSTNKYWLEQHVQQLIHWSDSVPLSLYVNGNNWRCLHIPSIHSLLSQGRLWVGISIRISKVNKRTPEKTLPKSLSSGWPYSRPPCNSFEDMSIKIYFIQVSVQDISVHYQNLSELARWTSNQHQFCATVQGRGTPGPHTSSWFSLC